MEEGKIWTLEEKAKLKKPVIACPAPYTFIKIYLHTYQKCERFS